MSQRDEPRLALNNITAGVCEREDPNRTRVAGHLDEIQGVVASTHAIIRSGVGGFIDMQAHVLNAFATAVSNDNIR
jgi:hypothetical protein